MDLGISVVYVIILIGVIGVRLNVVAERRRNMGKLIKDNVLIIGVI